jgi:hypothetical protein
MLQQTQQRMSQSYNKLNNVSHNLTTNSTTYVIMLQQTQQRMS